MKHTPELLFRPGLILDQEFFNYPEMQASAKNWHYFIRYRFGTGAFYGRHNGVQLNNLQFGHASRNEGMMYEGISPKECITIGILEKSSGRVCINGLKMEAGEAIIIDDSKPYDFVSSHHTFMTIISIHKTLLTAEIPCLLYATDKIFKDNNNILSNAIERKWREVLEVPNLLDNVHELQRMEHYIVEAIKYDLAGQIEQDSHLTEGEKTALEIKSFLLNSIEDKITIQSITEQFKISDKTLESSFKSLFGITPKHFIHLLKLNHAHADLQLSDKDIVNVSDIATKWGFSHFGRFSKEYKALFGVLPSVTLKLTPIGL